MLDTRLENKEPKEGKGGIFFVQSQVQMKKKRPTPYFFAQFFCFWPQ